MVIPHKQLLAVCIANKGALQGHVVRGSAAATVEESPHIQTCVPTRKVMYVGCLGLSVARC